MSTDETLQALASAVEQLARATDRRDEPVVRSPYLTAEEAAVYLKFPNVGALYDAIPAMRIPTRRRGRTLLFHVRDLDRWTAGEPAAAILRDARKADQSVSVHDLVTVKRTA